MYLSAHIFCLMRSGICAPAAKPADSNTGLALVLVLISM